MLYPAAYVFDFELEVGAIAWAALLYAARAIYEW